MKIHDLEVIGFIIVTVLIGFFWSWVLAALLCVLYSLLVIGRFVLYMRDTK